MIRAELPTDELQCQVRIWGNFGAICRVLCYCSAGIPQTPTNPATLPSAQEVVALRAPCPVSSRCRRTVFPPGRVKTTRGQPDRCAKRLRPLAQRVLA